MEETERTGKGRGKLKGRNWKNWKGEGAIKWKKPKELERGGGN